MQNLFLSILGFLTPIQPILDCIGLPQDANIEELWVQNKERWEFQPRYEEKREELKPIFTQLGYLDEVLPTKNHYDYALVIGATKWPVQRRVAFLEKVLENTSVGQIVFLGSTRPLLPAEGEGTEIEMMRQVHAASTLPPAQFISGEGRTSSTITTNLWLQTNPVPGNCLIITTQPFVHFHEAIFEQVLPFSFEVVAPEAPENWTVALLLDTIAKSNKMSDQQ